MAYTVGVISLALDTSTPYLTLALRGPFGTVASAERIERAHAELLPHGVAALFQEAGLPLRADRIVLGTGPGSYTGVRIGASYALALARVWEAPLVGVSTLTALLSDEYGLQAPALDARRGQVYGALYRVTPTGTEEVQPPSRQSAEEFRALAEERRGQLRQDVPPSGLSLLQAAATLGRPEPQLHLSYL